MRVSGFVMTDESGEVLAVSVGGAADLAKSLAAPKAAPESPAELVEEHKRLVDVLRSPSHADDLAEADRQEAELAEYEGEMSKSRVAAHVRKDGAFIPEHERRVEAYGVKGMKSTPWRKQFKNQKAFEDWLDKNEGDVEVHGVSHEDHGAMSKAHVQGYTRKDGTFVKEHDDKRQAAQPKQPSVRPVPAQKVNAIADKHSEAMISKSPDWDHNGFRGRKVPAADVAGLPEFSHKEVYGHDGKTSPAATDFAKEFADKGHQGFVIRHPNGKRSFVDTQGYGYARYHAPVEDAPAADAPAQASSSSGKFEYPSHVKNWSDKAHFLEQIPESQRTPEWKAAYKKASVQAMYGKGQSPDYKAHLAASKSGGSVGASYDHPNVVGKADFGKDTLEKGSSMKFAGTEYSATGKTGNSMHDQTPVREFEAEDGHRVWADGAGRVHADSRDEVPALRKKSEGAAKPAAKPKGAVSRKAAASPAGDDAPAEGEVGHHEHTTYGVYHRPGSTVKDNYGKTHKVLEHRGAQVLMEDGTWFHPTKVHKQGDKPMAKALMFVGSGASVAELAALTKVSEK